MALTQQDLDQAYQYVLSKGMSIQGLTDGGADLSRMYLAPVMEYNQAGTAANLVRLAVSLLKGDSGKSAYEEWKEQEGNSGKTLAEFFASLKGAKGDPFTYSDFTPEQLDNLRMTFDKMTSEEIAGFWAAIPADVLAQFQKPATDAAAEVREEMTRISQEVNQALVNVSDATTDANNAAGNADQARISLAESVQQKLTEVDNKMLTVKDGKTTQFGIGTVESGETPSATLTDDGTDEAGNPKKKLNLVMQKGDTGAVPVIGKGETTTGLAGTDASLEFVPDGVTEDGIPKYKPVAVIPAGATGTVEGLYQIQTIDHVPGENDLTYEIAGKTYPFQVGNELRYYDPEQADYVFYKLFDIKDGKAVWKLAGTGGSDDTLVYLSAPEDFETSYIEIKDGGLGGL